MKNLEQKLNTIDVFAIVAGVMISSGIFILPGIAYREAGPAVVLSYLIAAIIYVPAIMSVVELATAMPRAGGAYFVVDRSLGPAAGTLAGVADWLSLALKSAFALVGISALAGTFLPNLTPWQLKMVALTFCAVFVIVNLVSVELAGKFQVFLVAGLLGVLVYYIIGSAPNVNPARFTPFAPNGVLSVLATAGMVFVSFTGITKAASVAEETKTPGKTLPLGIFLAFGLTVLLYVLIVYVTVGTVPGKDLAGTLTPIADGAQKFGGNLALILINIGAFFAFATTANAGIMGASRDLLALSRDGHLPGAFQQVNEKYKTPHFAILLTGVFVVITILLLPVTLLVKTASSLQIILMVMIMLAVIVMRESRIFSYKPSFKSPLYPYLQIAGIVGMVILMVDMGLASTALALAFLIAGLFWFWIYTRIQVKRKPALVYLMERYAGDESGATGVLKRELKDIVHHRDSLREDAFDKVVKDAPVLDLQWHMPLTGFYRKAAKLLSKRLGLPQDEIYDRLMNLEAAGDSVVRPGLAASCLLVKEDVEPTLLISRNVSGIDFSPILPPVYAAFVMVLPEHKRGRMMRFLMAITEITQNPKFDGYWFEASDEEELRDIMHFGARRRIYDVYCLQGLWDKGIDPVEFKHGAVAYDADLQPDDLYGLSLMKVRDFSCRITERNDENEDSDDR